MSGSTLRALLYGVDAAGNLAVFVTDGTSGGSSELSLPTTGTLIAPSFGGLFVFSQGHGYFPARAAASSGNGLFVTDGSLAGTSELSFAANPDSSGLRPSNLTVFGGRVAFFGRDQGSGSGLFVTDGSQSGSTEITIPGAATSAGGFVIRNIGALGNDVVFGGGSTTTELYVSDGSSSGTTELTIANEGSAGLAPSAFQQFGSIVLFQGTDSTNNRNLFRTDGSVAGTSEITVAQASTSFVPSSFTVVNDRVVFTGTDSTGRRSLFSTFGTDESTTEITIASSTTLGPQPVNLVQFGSRVAFTAVDAAGNRNLFLTDGTQAGTSEVTVPAASATGLNPGVMTVFGSKLLFEGFGAGGAAGLFISDGTSLGTTEITVAGSTVTPFSIVWLGPDALFTALDSAGIRALFETDGTSAGTSELSIPGAASTGLAARNTTAGLLVACFAAGTRIATEHGERPVEALAPGDRVRTLIGGALATVRWVGVRPIDVTRHPFPAAVWPIRIAAGAFGAQAPSRDLRLSPDHAVYVGGHLIPARCLVNGATIRVEPATRTITYHHVELDRHDVILAEGLPAESWLDTGNRHMFANAGPLTALHPAFEPHHVVASCAPRVSDGPVVVAVRRRLASIRARAPHLARTATGS